MKYQLFHNTINSNYGFRESYNWNCLQVSYEDYAFGVEFIAVIYFTQKLSAQMALIQNKLFAVVKWTVAPFNKYPLKPDMRLSTWDEFWTRKEQDFS